MLRWCRGRGRPVDIIDDRRVDGAVPDDGGIIGDMGRVRSEELRDLVIEALGDEAMPVATLRARLGPPWDQPIDRDELDRLLQLDTSFTDVTDGVVWVPALLEGTAWTVWIDPDDATEGFVRMHPGLEAMSWWLVGADVELVDAAGTNRGVLENDGWMLDGVDTDVLLGPEGWLDEMTGRWASVEVLDGAVRWSPLEAPPEPTPAQVAAITVGFDRATRQDAELDRDADIAPLPPDLRFTSGSGPIHEAVLADRQAFRAGPIPPLTDLYAAAGLIERNNIIAEEGFDWDALRTWQTRTRLGYSYGLIAPRPTPPPRSSRPTTRGAPPRASWTA